MALKITWHGHATWELQHGSHSILLDPFLTHNPAAKTTAEQLQPEVILISHGHEDHVADAASIAQRCGSTLIANYEIATWFAKKHHVAKTIGMNLGGKVKLPFCEIKMTLAFHSSQLPDGSYGGNPCGYVVSIANRNIYFACDTALFGDMKFIGEVGLNAAVLPIGDSFTMGPEDALTAVKLLGCQHVFPSHYNTWPPIAQDAAAWAKQVKSTTPCEPHLLQPGESYVF